MKKKDVLQRLKWQRAELDDLIHEIGGKEQADTVVSAETANDMIRSAFKDVEEDIFEGRIVKAYLTALRYKNKKWFEGVKSDA